MNQPRIYTALTIGVVAIVITLSVTLLILSPEQSLRWLSALLFFPAILLVVQLISKREAPPRITPKMAGGIRTGIVGGGVLIATALATVIGEHLDLVGAEGETVGNKFLLVLPAIIAVAIDLFTARLEKKAGED